MGWQERCLGIRGWRAYRHGNDAACDTIVIAKQGTCHTRSTLTLILQEGSTPGQGNSAKPRQTLADWIPGLHQDMQLTVAKLRMRLQ